MATIKRAYAAQAQIIGAGDAYVTLSGVVESFSSDVDLETDGYEGAHVVIEMDYDATPTDEVVISIYGSLDGAAYDDTPINQIRGDMSVDPQQISFIVRDLLHFRIGVVQEGATDSHDVRSYAQRWRWDTV